MESDLTEQLHIDRQRAIDKIASNKKIRASNYTPRKSFLEPYRYEILTMYQAKDSLELIATYLEIKLPRKPARSTILRYLESIGVSRG
jgi:hypothetical protein